jgi:serine protease Do
MKKIKIRYLAVAFLLMLSLTLGAGCDLLPNVDTSPPEDSTTPSDTTPVDTEWSMPGIDNQAAVLPSIADVVAKVKPSVVAINTEVVTVDIFNQSRTEIGAGSGWIIDENGLIVTNNHVVEGAETVTVVLDDGRTFAAETVRTDSLADLAIVKIDARNLPAVDVGDSSQLRIGDWVVAIGNSLGRGISATTGIVSSLEVSIAISLGQTLYGLIQTDAPINPGNSGGPLVSMAGEVIGITSAKLASVEVEGVGYAISSNEAMPIIQKLITSGYVVRPWLGVSLYTVDQYVIQRYELEVDQGVLVVTVAAGSPADEAGLEEGDVITEFAGQEMTDVNGLIREIHEAQVGQEVAITYWRGEIEHTTSATLVESPPPPQS